MGQYIFLAKINLKRYEEIRVMALGEAISVCSEVAETLTRNGFTTIKKLIVDTLDPSKEDQQKENYGNRRRGKKARMIVTL